MALSKENYQEFEDIVGSNNISDDPALLDSYTYPLTATAIHLGPHYGAYTPRGLAVLLPKSTEEVQAIVKLCNKYKLKVKASSTFWSAMGYPSNENTIQIDMRRMDRVIEIDKKNMFAVVEPYVISAVLQAEAMKVGLNINIIGAGSSCSVVANTTSYMGPGPSTIYMGYGEENMLGVEWVLPNGEILRTGSLGSGLGWFCPAGPGPGLRGLVRGSAGAKGAMGVITKVAVKLSAWPGPATLKVEGTVPAYRTSLPKNFRAYSLAFPTWEAWAEGCRKIWDAEIGYIAHRQFNMFGRDLKVGLLKILTDPTKTLSDLEELVNDPEVKKVTEEMKRDIQFVLAGMTADDIAWQEKALDQILVETGGWKVVSMNDPIMEDWALLYFIRMGHKNLNLVYGGGYDGCFGLGGPPEYGAARIEEAGEFKKKWEEKGMMVQGGGECSMGGISGMGGGGSTVWENFTHFDPYDKKSVEGVYEFFDASFKFGLERGWGPGMERGNSISRGANGKSLPQADMDRMLLASRQPSVFRFQHKIKEILDPNDLGDSYYLTIEEVKKK